MNALHTLMEGIIDYAGLFPPAGLAMQPVVANYAAYRHGPHRALLGRLICPTTRMGEFAECAAELVAARSAADRPWAVAALGRGGDDLAGFLAGVTADVAEMWALAERFGPRVRIDAYECRLPMGLVDHCTPQALTDLAAQVAMRVSAGAPGPLTPYFEVPLVKFADEWRRDVPRAIAGLAEHNRRRGEDEGLCGPCGVKLRTGGIEAAAFPSVDQVACVIRSCASERIAFKATAGLHHPLRHFAESVGTKMHGFLNVFGAAVLARAHDLDAGTVACILEDERAEHFRCDAEGFHWQKRFAASVEEIAEARREFAHGFGSCSFDEPIEDLRALGMM